MTILGTDTGAATDLHGVIMPPTSGGSSPLLAMVAIRAVDRATSEAGQKLPC
jgi:hypothetical protein